MIQYKQLLTNISGRKEYPTPNTQYPMNKLCNRCRIAVAVLLVQLLGAAVVWASDTDQADERLAALRQQQVGVQTIGEEGSPPSELKITRDQAVSIARKHLAAESFASTYDTARMTVRYCPNYGEPKAPFACWMVDFAKVGTGEIIAGSGQWEMGYRVLVDPDTGKVKEATGYKR